MIVSMRSYSPASGQQQEDYRFVFCVKTLPAMVLAALLALALSSVLAAVAATLGEVVLLMPACDNALAATDFAAALAPGVLSTWDALVATLGDVFSLLGMLNLLEVMERLAGLVAAIPGSGQAP
ncbi:hypothetical protein ACG0Z3_07490 [Roseateles sp. LKC17W]|uniref:Uncharacterized protein n=1 Tax=Pelomonas margarita TaxID=3299031 RepID=A0ABW7FGL0_9BURK